MNLIFDRLKKEELEEVAKLYDAERPVTTNRIKMVKTFSKIKDNPDYYMITVKQNGEIIAFAKAVLHHDIFEENNPYMTIWSVRVKEKYRHQGIATQLFGYIEELANSLNCEFICLLADKDNIVANHFYQKLGYESDNGYTKILK